MAVLPPGTALPLALHSPRGLPSRWPLTAVLPRFCPVIGAECDSQAPTDTPGTVLCTVVLLLSTCCVQGSREREALGEARVSQAAPSRLVVSLRPPSVCCLPALCPAWAGHVFGGLLGLQMLLSRDTPPLHARALAAALSMSGLHRPSVDGGRGRAILCPARDRHWLPVLQTRARQVPCLWSASTSSRL